jgi:choline monooxygenase
VKETTIDEILGGSWAADLHRPAGEARGLPGAAYAGAAFYELERRTLFPRVWLAAAMASEIPAPGSVLPRAVAGLPLLFVRDRAGAIRCFHNVCRHRGMAVATSACRDRRMLQCPWHGWTYGLDGQLLQTPEFAGPQAHDLAGFDRGAHGLLEVRIACWFDFVFVNLDGRAGPLEDSLAPLTRRFRAFDDFSAYRYAESWQLVYEANWKICVEGAIEDYHLPWLHPEITEGHKRADRSAVEIGGDCFYAVISQSDRLAEGRTPAEVPRLPQVAGVAGPDARSIFFLNIFPTGVMGISPDGLYAGTWLPDGPDRTELTFHFYFVGEDGARDPRYEASRARWIDMVKRVFEQDAPIVRAVHERAATRDEIGISTRFSPFWESAVQRFQQRVCELVALDRAPSFTPGA